MAQVFTDVFEELFREAGLSKEVIAECANDFLGIVFLHILGSTGEKLTHSEKDHLEDLLGANNYSGVIEFLASHYSPEEWDVLLEQKIKPLFNEYIENLNL